MAEPPQQDEATPTTAPGTPDQGEEKVEVKKEVETKSGVIAAFEDLIETVITTIQEPEVTDEGVAAVVSRLQAYSAGITGLVESLPPDSHLHHSNGISNGTFHGTPDGDSDDESSEGTGGEDEGEKPP